MCVDVGAAASMSHVILKWQYYFIKRREVAVARVASKHNYITLHYMPTKGSCRTPLTKDSDRQASRRAIGAFARTVLYCVLSFDAQEQRRSIGGGAFAPNSSHHDREAMHARCTHGRVHDRQPHVLLC